MHSYPLRSLILIFENLFPNYKDPDNVYYPLGSNSIKVITRDIGLIFTYHGINEWSLNTLKFNDHLDEEVIELRRQLTISQKRLKNSK